MALPEAQLLERAQLAYERGRALGGLRASAAIAPMAAVSWALCGRPSATLLGATLLVLLVTTCVWRGGALARGARIGLWAGLPPLVLPLAALVAGHTCGVSFCGHYPALCLAGGVLAGGVVTWSSPKRHASPIAAAAVAILAGTLGCLIAGLTGVLLLAAGIAIGAGPALLRETEA